MRTVCNQVRTYMREWNKFLGRFDSLDERVIGTYLYPRRWFLPIDLRILAVRLK